MQRPGTSVCGRRRRGSERPGCCRRLGLADHIADLGILVVEDGSQQKRGPLVRAQAFEQDQKRLRQRLAERRGSSFRVDGYRHPRPDVFSAATLPQAIDAEPGRGADQESFRRRHSSGRLEANERILHGVLGVGHAPEHPVCDRHHPRPKPIRVVAHGDTSRGRHFFASGITSSRASRGWSTHASTRALTLPGYRETRWRQPVGS